MKKLLLSLLVAFSGTAAMKAQLSCASPQNIATNGTITAPAITGTFQAGCWAPGATPTAIWYTYTAILNGEVTISSDLPINVAPTYSIDTRLSIFTGATCAALTCYDGNDDVSSTNYKSRLTFPVQAGTKYYIVWDNRWSALGFQFTFNFAPTACPRPSALSVNNATDITTNSATLSWSNAIGNPASYDIDYGPVGHTAGAGTIVNSTTTTKSLTSLPASTNIEYYLRSNCGGTQSGWTGPFDIYLAKTLPYANGFDNTTDPNDGFLFAGGFGLGDNAGYPQSGTLFAFSNTSATASNAWIFSRPISLAANEQVTINFHSLLIPAAASQANLRVTWGTSPTIAAQTNVAQTFNLTGSGTISWTPRTATFTATTAGLYYIGVNNSTPAVTTGGSLLVDSFNFTSVLSTKEFSASTFSVYPNPSNGIVNISNDSNYLLNSVNVMDLNGRTVKSVKLNGETSAAVNISDLSAGVYMMSINSDQGSVTKKIVKN